MKQPPAGPVVLIANDQEWTARAIATILTSNGYQVVHGFTARETLALAGSTDPDLVILDQQLPDFSGVEVCRRLREDPRFGPTLPVIITTAGPSGRPQRLTAYEAGAWEFYGQPLDAEALLFKIGAYVASYRQVRALRAHSQARPVAIHEPDTLRLRATEMLSQTRRNGASLCCVAWTMANVDDATALSAAVDAFRQHARAADLHGQLGPRDLVLVASTTRTVDARRIAERFRDVLASALATAAARIDTAIVAIDDVTQLPTDGAALFERLRLARAA